MNEQDTDGQEQKEGQSPKALEYGSPCFQRRSQHPEPGMPERSAEAVSVWYRRAGRVWRSHSKAPGKREDPGDSGDGKGWPGHIQRPGGCLQAAG